MTSRILSIFKKVFWRAALIVLSTFIGLIALELLVRMAMPQQLVLIRSDIWIPVDGIGHQITPSLDTRVNTGEGDVRLVTDESGHRINSDRRATSSDAVRILAVGDSFLEALQVGYANTVTARLERSLAGALDRDVVVINTGVSGYGPNHYLIKAKRELGQDEYDLVLVFVYVGNDIIDERLSIIPRRETAKQSFEIPSSLGARELVRCWVNPAYQYLRSRSHLVVFLKRRFLGLGMRLGLTRTTIPEALKVSEADSYKWDVTTAVLSDISTVAVEHGTRTVFCLLPADYQVNRKEGSALAYGAGLHDNDFDLDQSTRILRERLTSAGMTVVDATEILRAAFNNGDSVFGRVDRHLNAYGHDVLSDELDDVIMAELNKVGSDPSSP